uniref:F-box domain-containing protein n=1 Tax=Glossina palpalis gambiensis TaxID=67801 RepID=A0A1B0BYH0_9MUSC
MATNAEILPFHHQTILTFQTAAALTNYGGVGGGSSGISTASQLAAAWSMEDHLFQQTELPVLTRSTHHMLRFAPYAIPHRPQLQPIPPALYLQHAAAAAAVHAQHHHNLQQRTTSPASPSPTEGYHISNLFPEILELIFNELSVCDLGRAAQVCTAWRDVAYSKSIWKGVEAKLHLKRSSPSLFNCLVKRGIKKVQILSLRRSLKDLVLSVPALNSLNLSGCFNVTDVNLGHAFSVDLPNLKILDLSLCKQITDTSLGRIAQHLKNLQTLDLGGCCNITNTGLLLIAWGLKKLKHLNLRSCCISDQGIGHLAGLNKATAEGNLELEFLGLQDCNRLSDEALGHIAQGLTSLKSINLSFCLSITDSGLKHLARMPKLEQLNLNSCDNISDIGMAYLTESGSNLNSLDVSFCVKISDQALTHIAQGLYQLRSLSLNHCQITDHGILKIAKALPELEHLNIGQCEGITDKGLQTLAEELLNLKTIDLYGCNKLSSKGIDVIVKLPKLIELNLGLWLKR